MSPQYLVTGGAGFIGAAVVRSLVERGASVTVLDSGRAAGFANLDGVPVDVVAADISDADRVAAAVAGHEHVIHLAAQPSVPASIDAPLEDHEVNVRGTLVLLEAARLAGAKRFVFGSSNAVVAGHPPPAHERLTPRPVAPYGAGKASVEGYLTAYHRAYGIETVALRFANAYGPRSAHKTSVVAAFIRAYIGGGPLTIRGDGTQTRDFVHVSDVSRLVLACLDAPGTVVAGEIFQAGSGRETTLLELARLVIEAGGEEVPIVHAASSPGDVPRNYSDISKAARLLGFQPQVDLRTGLAQTLDWFRHASESLPTSP